MRNHLNPFASVICWCLMPNHFHWVVFVHRDSVLKEASRHPNSSRETTDATRGLPTQSSGDHLPKQSINQSIGVLLSSYTRAIHKQEKLQGSLFQKRTKAKPLIDEVEITAAYWNTAFGTQMNVSEGKSYLETCVEYIHQNPVYSGLVKQAEDWEFSSFRDYIGMRNENLIDYELIDKENLLTENCHSMTQSHAMTKTTEESHHPSSSRETTNSAEDIHHPNSSREMNTVIIGFGSNIEADNNIPKMLEILKNKVEVLKVSTMIETKPIGIEDQPDFTNGAVKIKTLLNQNQLKLLLKEIENRMGRDRTAPKFGPRIIDLDIVVWNGEIVDDDYYTRDFIQKSVREVS